jgi:hypothetical protein
MGPWAGSMDTALWSALWLPGARDRPCRQGCIRQSVPDALPFDSRRWARVLASRRLWALTVVVVAGPSEEGVIGV